MFGSESRHALTRPETIDEESLIEFTESNSTPDNNEIDKKRRQSIIPLSHQPKPVDAKKASDYESNNGDNEDADEFDLFIFDNFHPFSGSENVIDWLDKTDKQFNSHKISRNLRYIAIPLLVQGEAKRQYIRNKDKIKSYDDFYELLLTNYDITEYNTRRFQPNPSSYSANQHNFTHNLLTHKNISFEDQQKTTTNNFDLTDHLPPRPILRSTAVIDIGTTRLSGELSENKSHIEHPSHMSHHIPNSTCSLDQTTYVIHKAIIDNLIKNPKTFQGGKEDVKQWLEDIEQLFDTAQIPDSHKLDLIPYSLRGEARRWYKNTKASLTSWSIFVKELKEAFLSPFHDELAFKKLESYTQGINQPVRSFYNEVLKLCAETDPEMSESMKLRYLLKKAKPTLQYEIRKKKPVTTRQFLEYAKESEELLQLSNIDTELDKYDRYVSNSSNTMPSAVTLTRANASNPHIDALPLPTYDRKMNYNNYYNSNKYNNNRSNDYNNNKYYNSNKYNNTRSDDYNSHSSQPFNSSRSFNSFNSSFRRNNPSYNQTKSPYQHNHNTNNTTRHDNQTRQVNNITATPIPSSSEPTPLLSNSDFCTQCLETGHQASACPRF